MKKLITLLLLFSTAYAQTYVTPHLDTVNVVLKQGTPSSFVTTPTSATYTPNGTASNTITVKGYNTPVIPPPVSNVVPGYPATSKYTVSPVINWSGKSNTSITNLDITGGSTNCITLTNCHDITISGNNLHDAKANYGIYMIGCYNITIRQNNITNVVAGINHQDSPNGGGVVIQYNRFHNMLGPVPKGQYVQFNTVTGAGLSVSYNRGDNVSGQSNPEDCINMFKANGTATSPIQIVGNWINGGGPSGSGGGIMLGDNGGSYQTASGNILDNPGQYGIAIAGGDHCTISGNEIFAAKQSFTNIAVYVWGQGGFTVTNAVVSGNSATWTNSAGQLNGYWDSAGTAQNINNNWNAGLTAAILPPVNTW